MFNDDNFKKQTTFYSSPKMLTKKYGLTKELSIVLTRTPTPSPASTASYLSTQVQQHTHMFTLSWLLYRVSSGSSYV